MSRIEQLIEEIEEYIDGCKPAPLSNNKILVNREELEELLVELRLRVPDEIKQYQRVISNQEAIMNDARTQADAMLQEAKSQTNEMVNDHEITQAAYQAANQIIDDANVQAQAILDAAVNDANNIRQGAIQYTDDALRNLQNIIAHTVDTAQNRFEAYMNAMKSAFDVITNNRSELHLPPQPQDASVPTGGEGREGSPESYTEDMM